jgi:prepilin-type N-terminal cleavage/methylation domain-containing protein
MKKTAGFTIAEVLITLTIAAILAAIAVPSFSWLIRDTRFTTEANNMVAAFNLARSEAAKRGGVARVDSDAGTNAWGTGWTLWVDQGVAPDGLRAGAGTATTADDTETLRVGNPLPSPLTLTAAAVVSVQYQPTGVARGLDAADAVQAPPYTFDLCNGESGVTGRRITISNTGHVSVAQLSCP